MVKLTEAELDGDFQGLGRGAVMFKRCYAIQISYGDLLYRIVPMANNSVLYT